MHCPQCGQPETSGEVRFCRCCGFALSDVKELLVPELHSIKTEKRRKIGKGVNQGIALMLFGFVLVTLLAILRDLNLVPQVFVKIAALIFIVGGLVRMCYSFFYNSESRSPESKSDSSLKYDAATDTLIETNIGDNFLPPAHSIPIINTGSRSFNTAKIMQPRSITDHTTKSLKDSPE